MGSREAKRFRKLNRKTSEYLITDDVKKTVRILAEKKLLWKILALSELIAIIGMLIVFFD